MLPDIVRIFVSSTWLDLEPERGAVEKILQRFREAKFVGMEYFGSRDETPRAASISEVARSDLYLGIVAGRYGSGITEAEYDAARARQLPCFIYFKREAKMAPEMLDDEPEKRERLVRLKAKLKDGHTVAEFAWPFELASLVAADLHNWLFERYFSPALTNAASGRLTPQAAQSLPEDLARFTDLARELLARAGAQQRIALDAFQELTYEIPRSLERFRDTAELRAGIVRKNVHFLERLLSVSADDYQVMRELATNWRLLGKMLDEEGQWSEAFAAFEKSAEYCVRLVEREPEIALYQRDLAVSHYNAGFILEKLKQPAAARRQYELALPVAQRAARLDSRWATLPGEIMTRATPP